jgi:hypothetical protein
LKPTDERLTMVGMTAATEALTLLEREPDAAFQRRLSQGLRCRVG